MTREEEIIQKAISEQRGLMESCDWRGGFISGAKWADKTMLNKAREWVKNAFVGPFGEGLANNIADEFVKEMEK